MICADLIMKNELEYLFLKLLRKGHFSRGEALLREPMLTHFSSGKSMADECQIYNVLHYVCYHKIACE